MRAHGAARPQKSKYDVYLFPTCTCTCTYTLKIGTLIKDAYIKHFNNVNPAIKAESNFEVEIKR